MPSLKLVSILRIDPDRVPLSSEDKEAIAGIGNNEVREFLFEYSGASFNNALYRIATPHYIRLAKQFLALAFPADHRSVLPFGFFWDGSIVAVDGRVRFEGKYAVTAFFPESGADGYGTAEANIESLHTDLLDEGWEDTTRESTYRHLLAQGCSQPTYGEFLACQRPQFLGGLEEASNLAIQDAEVYWHVTAQLIDSVRGLTVGTKSTQVDLH